MNKLSEKEIESVRSIIREKFAQNPSSDHDRFYGDEEESHLGEKYIDRDEFSRDRDRILYTNAFRRLQHKAQVYSNKKGDHYRTRLTHTLEVNQIAKSISKNLRLNIDLTEAIALGHDIGHTPFGHAGEEVLDNIMKGKDDLGGKLEYSIDFGGFKHNMNSIKILELLEEKNGEKGLNLTWQTLDGILKHTSIIKEKKNKKWDLRRFVNDYSNYEFIAGYDYYDESSVPTYKFPLTLEGQVVAIADEIAQREHDIDDSLRDRELDFEKLFSSLEEKIIGIVDEINPNTDGYDYFILFKDEFLKLESFDDESKRKEFFSLLVSYFIIDVTENTMKNIFAILKNDEIDEVISIGDFNRKYIIKELVNFSEVGEKFNKTIEEFIEKRVINSFNVNRFDGKGKFILRQLFKAYYENPRQMPRSQLKFLSDELKVVKNDFPDIKDSLDEFSINIDELFKIIDNEYYFDLNNLEPLLKFLKLTIFMDDELYEGKNNNRDNKSSLINFEDTLNFLEINLNDYNAPNNKEFIKEILKDLFNKINNFSHEEIKKLDAHHQEVMLLLKGLMEFHYVYLSTICDYIAKMTDDYALKEYNELYSI